MKMTTGQTGQNNNNMTGTRNKHMHMHRNNTYNNRDGHSDIRDMKQDNRYINMVNADMDNNLMDNREMCRNIEGQGKGGGRGGGGKREMDTDKYIRRERKTTGDRPPQTFA